MPYHSDHPDLVQLTDLRCRLARTQDYRRSVLTDDDAYQQATNRYQYLVTQYLAALSDLGQQLGTPQCASIMEELTDRLERGWVFPPTPEVEHLFADLLFRYEVMADVIAGIADVRQRLDQQDRQIIRRWRATLDALPV